MTLIDGGRSESEAQIIEPTESDQDGQLLMDGLLTEGESKMAKQNLFRSP
jgi:hypothetical protein